MCMLVNWQTSVELLSLLTARFLVFLVLSLVCCLRFFSPHVPDQYLEDVDVPLLRYVSI